MQPRRCKKYRVEKNFGDDFYTQLVEKTHNTYDNAMDSIDATFWKEAINNKIQSIMQNQTLKLADLPLRCKPIGYRWLFRKKYKPDEIIEKYKARLIAKGFALKNCVDYFECMCL